MGERQHLLSSLGKIVYDKGTATEQARNLLANVGKDIPVSEDVINDMKLFTIRYIYNDKQSMSLSAARAKKLSQQKKNLHQEFHLTKIPMMQKCPG